MITIRAKTTIKIDTGRSSVDCTHVAGTPIEAITKNMLHVLIQQLGYAEALALVENYMTNNHDPKYIGFTKDKNEQRN